MEQTLTIVCKLQPTPEQSAKMDDLLRAFADACNYTNEQVKPGITSKATIQSMVYQDIRSRFGLSANQAVRVCARVGANRKAAKTQGKPVQTFAPTSADYDARIFDFREKDKTVSLTLLGGREHIPVVLANYQAGKLKGRKPTSAQLCKHRDGLFYIHIQLTDKTPEPTKSGKVIGVDFGRRDIAVTSDGEKWDGKEIQQVRDKFSRVRASLQRKASKGTRSTRRRARQILKRLSGRERRYQQWLNHNISKKVIDTAKASNAVIAIEDLTGIRERTNQEPRHKTERRRSNSWAFYQLRLFLTYKAIKAGVELVAVPPAYTSQTCHVCNHIGLRSDKRFKCGNCGWHGDADLNGAINISKIGAVFVSQPGGSDLACSLNRDDSGLPQDPRLSSEGESPRASAGG
ncbi:transposase [Laspinema sp. D1]|uniref:Transposase n=2 Tax=Laspinema TaxID=2584823 RepID=A0ABT2MWS0_9CYAN|nr:transposase [Laspinema sp. D3b]MCT7968430.1 transposase [Laspinema sp. D2a]MCT7980447.1 transposase [Laspinema sp. D3b]